MKCPQCNQNAKMDVLNEYVQTIIPPEGITWANKTYILMLCPKCEQVSLESILDHSELMEPDEREVLILYPQIPQGLPKNVEVAYRDAMSVKVSSPNAYGALLRKVIEEVCLDRKANGRGLYKKIEDLGKRGEIPVSLVEIAHNIRDLGDRGVHAELGQLTEWQTPLLESLCKVILEYLYYVPYLAAEAKRQQETEKWLQEDDDTES